MLSHEITLLVHEIILSVAHAISQIHVYTNSQHILGLVMYVETLNMHKHVLDAESDWE